jgi:hypothetical protein
MPDPFPLTSLADLADGVTVVPFHPKHAQWVKNRVKLLDMVTVIQRQSFGGGSVMVWGGITAHGRTPLVVVAGNLTGIRYRDEMVQPYVIPFIPLMHAWQRRRIDLTKLLKIVCGILFQMRINAGPISAKVTGRFGRWRNRRSISSQA